MQLLDVNKREHERPFYYLLMASSMGLPYSFAGSVSLAQPWHFLMWTSIAVLFALAVENVVPAGLSLVKKAVLIATLIIGSAVIFMVLN